MSDGGIKVFLDTPEGRVALAEGATTLGRSRTCGVRLNDPSISRNHAILSVSPQRVTLKDLDSSNGTFVNGERLQREIEIEDGDALVLGEVTLQLRIENDPAGDATVLMPRFPAMTAPAPSSGKLSPSSSEAIAVGDVVPVGEVLAKSAPSWEKTGILELPPSAMPPPPPAWPVAVPSLPAAIPPPPITPMPPAAAPPLAMPAPVAPPPMPGPPPAAPSMIMPEPERPSTGEILRSFDDIERELAQGTPARAMAGKAVAGPRGGLPPAGFGRRAVALLVDVVLIAAVVVMVQLLLGTTIGSLAGLALWLLIALAGWTHGGTSPGKSLLGLAVCDADTGAVGISVPKAVLRLVGYLASGLTLGLGHLLALVQREKRALQDLIAGTYVGKRP